MTQLTWAITSCPSFALLRLQTASSNFQFLLSPALYPLSTPGISQQVALTCIYPTRHSDTSSQNRSSGSSCNSISVSPEFVTHPVARAQRNPADYAAQTGVNYRYELVLIDQLSRTPLLQAQPSHHCCSPRISGPRSRLLSVEKSSHTSSETKSHPCARIKRSCTSHTRLWPGSDDKPMCAFLKLYKKKSPAL